MKLFFCLSALMFVLSACSGGSGGNGGNKVVPPGGNTAGSGTTPTPPSKISIEESDLRSWSRVGIRDRNFVDLVYLNNYDSDKDGAIFCGAKADGLHCAQYVFNAEKMATNAFGNRTGVVVSRELVELAVPEFAKKATAVFTKFTDEYLATRSVFCINDSGKESCWTYDAEVPGYDGVMGCADRDGKLKSPLYSRIRYPGVPWLICGGPFVEVDGYNYHFYGDKDPYDGKQTVRIERCSLDRHLDTTFGEEGSLFVENAPSLKVARIDIALKTNDGILLASAEASNQNGRIHMLDSKMNFSRKFSPAFINFNGDTGSAVVFAGLTENADHTLAPVLRYRQGPHNYKQITTTIQRRGGDPEKLMGESIACAKYLY